MKLLSFAPILLLLCHWQLEAHTADRLRADPAMQLRQLRACGARVLLDELRQ